MISQQISTYEQYGEKLDKLRHPFNEEPQHQQRLPKSCKIPQIPADVGTKKKIFDEEPPPLSQHVHTMDKVGGYAVDNVTHNCQPE